MSDDDMEIIEPKASDQVAKRRLKSQVHDASGRATKGRGFKNPLEDDRMDGHFESLTSVNPDVAQKSVEGWVLFVTGVHEEAANEDIQDAFADFGVVKNTWMNLDRQTGFVKGYALVEFTNKDDAETAIASLDGTDILGSKIAVTWAFVKPTAAGARRTGAAAARRR